MTATEVVQRQLDAYNAQDLDAFCACFAADCVLAELNGAVTQQGAAAVRARYREGADLIAFGRPFIANPDLGARLKQGGPFNTLDRATLYGGGDAGYLDYPTLG